MSFWMITSWVFVGLLTAANVFVFIKLKSASEQMMRQAFPNAKNMGDAMAQMQRMMGMMTGTQGGNPNQQMKAAMDMLGRMGKNQQGPGGRKF